MFRLINIKKHIKLLFLLLMYELTYFFIKNGNCIKLLFKKVNLTNIINHLR